MPDTKSESIYIKCSCLVCNNYTSSSKRGIKNHLKEAHSLKKPKARFYRVESSGEGKLLEKAKGWFGR